MSLNKDDATSIEKEQELMADNNVKCNLIYISINFGTHLEKF